LKRLLVIVILGAAIPAWAQYAGPAILTRGDVPTGMKTSQIDFRPFLSLSALYDTGLSPVAVVNDSGDLANLSSAGLTLTWGVSGTHGWKTATLGLNYQGSINHYARSTSTDGINQSFGLGLTKQLSRRTSLVLRQSAGMFTRSFGLVPLQQSVPFDPGSAAVPTTDFFDNRTIYMNSQAQLIHQYSARLSFSLGGGYFDTRRRASALYGTAGESAYADVQYRLSRRSTIGVNYNYGHYSFSKGFGGTDLHSAQASYGLTITRSVEFSGYAGLGQAKTIFIENIRLDPVIAALLGQSLGAAVGDRSDVTPNLGARISKSIHNGVFAFGAEHGIKPGNGLFLTSTATNVYGQYSYTGLRWWSFSLSANYNKNRNISNLNGTYGGYAASAHASRSLGRSLHAVATFSARQYSSQEYNRYNRLMYSATAGLAWAPGDVPLRLW
jgi:hypothetical protein